MKKDELEVLRGLDEVAQTGEERAKVDALRERWQREGHSAFKQFLQQEPLLVLRLADLAFGKEEVDLSLMNAFDKMGVDPQKFLKKKPH